LLSNAKTVSHRSSALPPRALDPVGSISLAYCWVPMTPLRLRPLSIHRGHCPLDSRGSVHTRSHSGGLRSFNALPLRRTIWYSFLPFTPGIRMLAVQLPLIHSSRGLVPIVSTATDSLFTLFVVDAALALLCSSRFL
jgi:hypothetical protein